MGEISQKCCWCEANPDMVFEVGEEENQSAELLFFCLSHLGRAVDEVTYRKRNCAAIVIKAWIVGSDKGFVRVVF